MKGKPVLYIDQFGNKMICRTVKALHEKFGGRVSKMYRDKIDGKVVHCGYVLGRHWFTAYVPMELPA